MLTRDQQRAAYAYSRVGAVYKDFRKDYKIAVMALGSNILRSGMVAALADLQRKAKYSDPPARLKESGGLLVLKHLAAAGIPHLVMVPIGTAHDAVPDTVRDTLATTARGLHTLQYMLATREMLQVVLWLKRAAQATFVEDEPKPQGGADEEGH